VPGLTDVKVTLYDIFGYLLPGLVALGALGTLAWSLFWPRHPLHAFVKGGAGWFALIVTGYVIGHLVQAVANWLAEELAGPDPESERRPEKRAFSKLPQGLRDKIEAGTKVKKNARLNYRICDTVLGQSSVTGDREMYQYREGFYRGLVVALPLAFAAMLVRLGRDGAAVKSGQTVHTLSSGVLGALAITLGVAALLAWGRYRRFQEYKINNAFLGYLALIRKFGQPPPP
jgi:hypothetical protein